MAPLQFNHHWLSCQTIQKWFWVNGHRSTGHFFRVFFWSFV
ncbi:GSCOCG00010750001-RA-CDS [Cotesia congregata]|nr:GSCOCG00010750001-RA-CDS [Cotesia congregata]